MVKSSDETYQALPDSCTAQNLSKKQKCNEIPDILHLYSNIMVVSYIGESPTGGWDE